MFCFVCYITPKITSNNYVPCGAVFFVKFLFDVCGNILRTIGMKKNRRAANEMLFVLHFRNRILLISSFVIVLGTKKDDNSHLFDVVFCQSLRCDIHSILLHFLAHVGILDHCFSLFRHCQGCCVLSSVIIKFGFCL